MRGFEAAWELRMKDVAGDLRRNAGRVQTSEGCHNAQAISV